MDGQEHLPAPKRRRGRRGPAEDATQVGSATGVPPEDDTRLPAPGIFPVEKVRVPWSARLGLVRHEVTAGAKGMGPRRMLLRDSSGVLMVLALVVLLASQAAPTPAADGGTEESFPAGGVVLFPTGSLDLLSPTPETTLAPGETARPTVDITKATLPPWCANPKCTVFVTPSPSPKPTKKPAPPPTAAPTPIPCDPLATTCPSPTPVQVAVPPFTGQTGTAYEAALASLGFVAAYDPVANDPSAPVTAVSPVVGTLVPVGSTVTITTSPPPPPPPTPDVTPPPDPTITSGPADGDTSATFLFTDTEAGVTFACQLNGGGYATCSSGVVYTVGDGSHTFMVTASDAAGNTSAPTAWSWTVPAPAP